VGYLVGAALRRDRNLKEYYVNGFDHIFDLHHILRHAKKPVPLQKILEKMECSPSTFKRVKKHMVDFLGAPIEYDSVARGYFYNDHQAETFELPGVWFTPHELHALLIIQHQLKNLQSGLLVDWLTPLTQKIAGMLAGSGEDVAGNWHRLRVLQVLHRAATPEQLVAVAEATLKRKKIKAHYRARTTGSELVRQLSPQRLLHYRDNWYLDAWCHTRNELRTFSVDRLSQVKVLEEPTHTVDELTLDEHFTSAFGIFSGKGEHLAVLKFSAEAAKWVADEQWHPNQQSQWQPDGSYELRVPFNNPTELMMDILKHGSGVEVQAPQSLRDAIKAKLAEALKTYQT
jgi:predicted DNA-binding transcriptional regulator YafY